MRLLVVLVHGKDSTLIVAVCQVLLCVIENPQFPLAVNSNLGAVAVPIPLIGPGGQMVATAREIWGFQILHDQHIILQQTAPRKRRSVVKRLTPVRLEHIPLAMISVNTTNAPRNLVNKVTATKTLR